MKITSRGGGKEFYIDLINSISGAILVLSSLDVYIKWI
jgi:hypothetical protein